MGWSMGGAVALQTAGRARITAEPIAGMILDSPVIDWRPVLRVPGDVR